MAPVDGRSIKRLLTRAGLGGSSIILEQGAEAVSLGKDRHPEKMR